MISNRFYKTFANKLYKSKALQNKSFLMTQQKKDSIEQSNLMFLLNNIINDKNNLHIQYTNLKKDFEIKKDFEAVQSLKKEFTSKTDLLNKKQVELKEKIKIETVSNKAFLNENVKEQSFTNNFIKESFSHAYNFNTGIAENLIKSKKTSYIPDQNEKYEIYTRERLTHLEQKASNFLVSNVKNEEDELYRIYQLSSDDKGLLNESDHLIIGRPQENISQEITIGDANFDFSVTEEIEEKAKEILQETYSTFEETFNEEAINKLESKEKDKSFSNNYI